MHWTVHIEGGPRRVNHAALAVGQMIYSFGGYCTGDNYSVQRPIDVHVLNPSNYRWKLLSLQNDEATPFQRYGHTVVAVGRFVYLWGGRNDEFACKVLYCFDTKTQKWSTPTVSGLIPGARDGHSAAVIRNKMFIFGGYEEEAGLFSQDVHALDLTTFTWSAVPATGLAPSFRDFHTATVYLDRYMFIFGGRGDEHGPVHTRAEMYCNVLVGLDVERQEWFRPVSSGILPSGRRSHSAFMYNGQMYVFGGYNGISDVHYDDFFKFDPESGAWTQLTPQGRGPAPRRRQGCVVVDTRVYFFGGTSPTHNDMILPPVGEISEEGNLIDHDDLFVLDMEPTLKMYSLLAVIANRSRLEEVLGSLPRDLRQELNCMVMSNQLTAPSTASG